MSILNTGKLIKAAAITVLLLLSSLQLAFADEVDINTADSNAIAEALPGIGEVKADAIVAYRDIHGPFTSLKQLAAVKGIGEKTLQKNAKFIVIK